MIDCVSGYSANPKKNGFFVKNPQEKADGNR